MKRIVIALLLAAALVIAVGCGKKAEEKSADDTPLVSSADSASDTDIVSDSDPAPDGFVSYEIDSLYFYYPENAVVTVSETDAFSANADADTGANFSVSKSKAVDMNIAELDKAALDEIGRKSASEMQKMFGDTAAVAYSYKDHGAAFDGSGVYFAFDIAVNYAGYESTQTLSYYQLYIVKGKDLYMATFATNTLFDDDAQTYFEKVIESLELKGETEA